MKTTVSALCLLLVLWVAAAQSVRKTAVPAPPRQSQPETWLGFDRNQYPGDSQLAPLRKTFAFTSYWLNNPPGAKFNTWKGKRVAVESAGFGFLVLFNGRLATELAKHNAAQLGKHDGSSAAQLARDEGFPKHTIIFLDMEEGGRLIPAQRAYLHSWTDAVNAAGYRAGVYCSGIPFKEGDGTIIVTADDIRNNAQGRDITFWIATDQCPPSPGCTIPATVPKPSESGVQFAAVWQYAQSPRRPQYTAACQQTYDTDRNCYAPGLTKHIHIDLNTALSPDPSHGRTQ